MVLQTTYQDKTTQTENKNEDTIEELLKVITTLSTKVDSMDKELQNTKNISQQHDIRMQSYVDRKTKNFLSYKETLGNSIKPMTMFV